MSTTQTIVNRVLSDLGVGGSTQIDYIVPARTEILGSQGFKTLDPSINSQYDLLLAKKPEASAA